MSVSPQGSICPIEMIINVSSVSILILASQMLFIYNNKSSK